MDDFLRQFPFMASPLHLMAAHRGNAYLKTPPHLLAVNRELIRFHLDLGGTWLFLNMPWRHGKTEAVSRGFTAWSLLNNPDTPILIAGHSEDFATTEYGSVVKEIVEKFGPKLGVKIRPDMKAKGQWKIEGRRGGMACFGPDTRGVGYEAGMYLIDDLVGKIEQAFSPGESEKHWRFFMGTVFGRLTNVTKLLVVGTRWSKRDIFGRLLKFARETGQVFRHVRFPALAVERDIDPATGRDPLGREIGEPLWPEHVSKSKIEAARKSFGSFWNAAYQQAPVEEEDALLRPHDWPTYEDMGHAWGLRTAAGLTLIPKSSVSVIITVDWAYSEKKKADRTAIPVGGLLPNGDLLILNCIVGRFAVEQGPRKLAEVCLSARPAVVGMEGHHAMVLECRRYPSIPEPRQLQPRSKAKIVRAVSAIEMGNAGRIWLPEKAEPWLDDFREEVGSFTGVDDERDDIPDALSWLCQLAQEFRGGGSGCPDPEVLTPAPNPFPNMPYLGGLG